MPPDTALTFSYSKDEFAELMNYVCLCALDHPEQFEKLREVLADKENMKTEDPLGYAAVVHSRAMWLGATFRLELEKRRLGYGAMSYL